jgi:hypothetical protein
MPEGTKARSELGMPEGQEARSEACQKVGRPEARHARRPRGQKRGIPEGQETRSKAYQKARKPEEVLTERSHVKPSMVPISSLKAVGRSREKPHRQEAT